MNDTRPVVFSVIVPTYGRPRQLAACLEGLVQQTTRRRFEVIVVDDGGTPVAEGVGPPFAEALDIRFLRQARRGPGAARDLGAEHARGPYLAFLDDDCVADPEWLDSFDLTALDDGVLLGGATLNGLPDNVFSTASHLINQFVYDYYLQYPQAERFFPSNNLAVSRAAFRTVGGFGHAIPASTSEDKDLCDRWRVSGRALQHAPHAVVRHSHALSLVSFVRQHFAYGRGIVFFRVLRRDRLPNRRSALRPEPLRFYLRLIAYPFSVLGPLRGALVSLLALVAQISTLKGAAVGALVDLPKMKR